ncbi:Oligosaccharide translocation protein rft1 [Malassezia yamatoensis]|uniref:Man(5)GlcNAc(2)-PP-dolichol translocation protein RFT1 n=1 Tax=Malassezia yamatoensis TaxID=253288 RepID=A0AAJ5YPS3_9BASI|nr:Oligosaccharide translocation protein rft1 [Malassezia yamatoensis]
MVRSPAAPARALLLLQVSIRAVTFVLNQLLVRTTTPAVFGAANVQLELLLSIILALARDGVRATVMRRRDQLGKMHNLALFPVLIGAFLSCGVGYTYIHYLAPVSLVSQGDALPISVSLYCAGALLELLSEPFLTRALALDGYIRIRVAMEAGSVLVRALVAVFLLRPSGLAMLSAFYKQITGTVLDLQGCALIAFSVSRATYGAVLLLVSFVGIGWTESWRQAFTTLIPSTSDALDRETRELVLVNSAQAALKFVLTEGDKLAVARLTTLEQQGGYALASNFGSLLARTVFQPIEESARLYFSDAWKMNKSNSEPSNDALDRSGNFLTILFRAHVLLGLILVTFAPPLSQPFLMIVAGPQWAMPPSQAPAVLASYCWYLPVMGINGVVEAFLQSTAPSSMLGGYSKVLLASSALFVGTLLFGHTASRTFDLPSDTLLVWANITGLSLRVMACLQYTSRTFAHCKSFQPRLLSSLPSRSILGLFAVFGLLLRYQASPLGPRAEWFTENSPLISLITTSAIGMGSILCLW